MIINSYIFDIGIFYIPNNIQFEIFTNLFNNYNSKNISLESIKKEFSKNLKILSNDDYLMLINTFKIIFGDKNEILINKNQSILLNELNLEDWKLFWFIHLFKSKKEIIRQNSNTSRTTEKSLSITISYLKDSENKKINLDIKSFIREYWDILIKFKSIGKIIKNINNNKLPINMDLMDEYEITNLKYNFIEKEINHFYLKIENCHNCNIFIKGSVDYVLIRNCINCIIFVSSVKKILNFSKNENTNLSSCSFLLKISNNLNCQVNCYTILEPILIGNNKSLKIGPFNCNIKDLESLLQKCDIPIKNKFLNNFAFPIQFCKSEFTLNFNNFQIVNSQSYIVLVLCFEELKFNKLLITNDELYKLNEELINENKDFDDNNSKYFCFLAPKTYQQTLLNRFNHVYLINEKKGSLNLDQIENQKLKNIIQGKFKENINIDIKKYIEMFKYSEQN